MNDLPALYTAVCAKRPELAVERLEYISPSEVARPHWSYRNFYEADDVAAALILARWVEMLPVGNGLYHAENYENGETRWWIGPNASMPTPIEALAVFWLQQ